MTLHEAMIKVMRGNGPMTAQEIADRINARGLHSRKIDDGPVPANQIRGRAKNYPQLFEKIGSCWQLKSEAGMTVVSVEKVVKKSVSPKTPKTKTYRDESYVIDLCDEILGEKASRQQRFDFLRGDTGVKLPVDAYYPSKNLVVEFYERQHTESVKIFDKMTASGVSRDEQRRIYDERRREILPQHGIAVVVIDYSELAHNPSNKKLLRSKAEDVKVIKRILAKYL